MVSGIHHYIYPSAMKKIYFLSTCDKCRDIIKRLGGLHDFVKQDIKTERITEEQLDQMKKLAGSYEALFSKRALKYKVMNLKEKNLKEEELRQLILEEYTFLLRPVIVIGKKIFIGGDKQVISDVSKLI